MTKPTAEQMERTLKIAIEVLAEKLGKSEVEVMQNHAEELFHMVCAFAAQA